MRMLHFAPNPPRWPAIAALLLPVLIAGARFTPAVAQQDMPPGIPADAIKPGSMKTHPYGEGMRRGFFLTRPCEIEGQMWERWTWVNGDGRMLQGELAREMNLGGVVLPAGSTVFFTDTAVDRVWLAHDMQIEGLPVQGGGKWECRFWPTARLRSAFLQFDQTIQGIPCDASAFHFVDFDETGRLTHCWTARAFEWDGVKYDEETELEFAPDGTVLKSSRAPGLSRAWTAFMDMFFM